MKKIAIIPLLIILTLLISGCVNEEENFKECKESCRVDCGGPGRNSYSDACLAECVKKFK